MAAATTQYYLSQFNTNADPLSKKSSQPENSPTLINTNTPIMSISPQQLKPEENNSSSFYATSLYQMNTLMNGTSNSNNRSETCSTNALLNTDQGLRIRVDGIPSNGAKSRVETQIKLTISLTTNDGVKVPYWSYVRIPEKMLARSKLRKSQQQKLLDGSAAAMVSDESKVLDLEARVVCESDENKKIKMCQGCVRRERKRAERKKDAKLNAANLNLNAGVVDEAFERDRKRILLFNTEPLVNFSAGEAILPTRITCYCRHHNERIGFRVRFVMKNDKGMVVASGESPPIMITDDHKSSKQRIPSSSASPNSATITTRKRRRNAHASSTDAEDESAHVSADGLTASATTSPVSSSVTARISNTTAFDALTTSVSAKNNSIYGSDSEDISINNAAHVTSPTEHHHQASPSSTSSSASTSPESYHNLSAPSVLGHFSFSSLSTPLNEEDAFLNTSHESLSPRTPTTATSWQSMMMGSQTSPYHGSISSLHSSTPSTSTTSSSAATVVTPGLMSASINPFMAQQPVILQEHEFFDDQDLLQQQPRQKFRRLNEHTMPTDTCSPSLLTVNPNGYQQQEQQVSLPSTYYSVPTTPYAMPVTSQQQQFSIHPQFTSQSHQTSSIPTLDRILPSHGPSAGGIEVTILGENFHHGLTLMFGNRPATTLCVSPTSMVVLLPPAEEHQQQGQVVVSFKDHPLMRTSPLPPVFHYYFDDTAPQHQQPSITPYSSQLSTPVQHPHQHSHYSQSSTANTGYFPASASTATNSHDQADMSFIYLS